MDIYSVRGVASFLDDLNCVKGYGCYFHIRDFRFKSLVEMRWCGEGIETDVF